MSNSLAYAQQLWECPPDDPEEGEMDLMLDNNPITVLYALSDGEVEVTYIVIAGMEFDAYSFSRSTVDYLQSQVRSKIC